MDPAEFLSLGDALWLDFVNTARDRVRPPADRLDSPAAYHRWLAGQRLRADADVPFTEVRHLRERLAALAAALDAGQPPPSSTVEAINARLAGAGGHLRLMREGGSWRLDFAPAAPTGALAAIARSAAETLADERCAVRECAGETCSLFFTDDSARQNRDYCSPAACGHGRVVERRRGRLE